jgi:signal transduction histidine kinase/ActR/RegA family two-component response regulator
MLTMLLAMLLSAGALLAHELLTYRRVWANDLRTQADLIARATAAAIVFDDAKSAQENLALLKARPSIQAAAVYGRDAAITASYLREATEHVPPRLALPLEQGGPRFDGSTVAVSYPIEHNGERVGVLYIRAEHDIWSRLLGYAVILGAVGAGSLGFAFYMFGKLQGHITTPLVKMTEVAHEVVTTRNWALRAPETQDEDVGVLVKAFNDMLTECGSRTSDLERQMAIRQKAEEELRLADRRKDQFLATLAHELRNPLAAMSNAVALIEKTPVASGPGTRAVTILDRQLRHLVRLIDDLLDASRITTGKLSLVRRPVELTQIIRETVELALPLATHNGLKLTLSLPEASLHVDGDAVRLSQVFSNLLHNACRYTPSGGAIDVCTERVGESAEVTVRDSGIGVAPDMQERIFELFEQADKSLERGAAGLGIGLTLARQLVQLHSGTLSVSSAGLGKGSSFIVRLPLLQNVPVVAPAPLPMVSRSASMRVLIADDNPDLTESFAAILRGEGYVVDVATDGEEAVTAAIEHRPDVALLDIGMPRRNGYEVARLLRSRAATSGIYLVAITGWGQESDKANAKAAGFDCHLVKPVDPAKLLKVLGEAFGPEHARDALEAADRP